MIVCSSRWKEHRGAGFLPFKTANAMEEIIQVRDTGVNLSHQRGRIMVMVGQQGAHTFDVVTEGEIIGNDEGGKDVEFGRSSEDTQIPK
jgi:hypothetical protein